MHVKSSNATNSSTVSTLANCSASLRTAVASLSIAAPILVGLDLCWL